MPDCQVCDDKHEAYADARLPSGSWAYICKPMFTQLGCQLGEGKGQKLVLQEPAKGHTWIDEQEVANPEKLAAALRGYRLHKAKLRAAEYAGDDDRFGYWLLLVDRRLGRIIGLSIFDMEDHTWRDDYEAGMSPKDALEEFARNCDDLPELVVEMMTQ